jgi:spermidine synthase
MNRRLLPLSLLLGGSGFCSLVYQTVWLREFRLVFGASTAASAAVLAIFIGGLGLGGLWLGERAERHPRPLALYAALEAGIALSAALTPALLALSRGVYLASGGSERLGGTLATALRLGLSALVLAVPTLLMGGTMPAAARAVVDEEDTRRRSFAVLYGANTLGAVLGSALTTFVFLEAFGSRRSLWLAALFNLGVALVAALVSHQSPAFSPSPAIRPAPAAPDETAEPARPAVARFALVAALLVGFVFFLMELVWYRMLGPLLGGSVFTFGTILAVALAGVGAGSFLYALLGDRRPATLGGFAATCLFEALFVALPYALGDRLAILAVVLRPLGAYGFGGHVVAWITVATLVIFPAAAVAGAQFPLLIGLLGRGREGVGREAGRAYAWNTAGAILGSLGGGFGLLPLLGATRLWCLVVVALVALGLGAAILRARDERAWSTLTTPLIIGSTALLFLLADGPTAAWRHSPIGAGRVPVAQIQSPQGLQGWLNAQRHGVRREFEGRESAVGLDESSGLSFVVGGKVDGNAIYDGPTQVMLGLAGALFHPDPRRSLVIGLGTGSTAGWLGAVPGMERVDVAELEPSMLRVAAECAPVNHQALANPKIHVILGDAREIGTVGQSRYDLVASEPSNPYRAGVASLFTRDFYEIAARRLAPGGLFLQWLQTYEVDFQAVRTIYATLRSVFPYVETWQLRDEDLMLVGSMTPIVHDADTLRGRIAAEPFRTALRDTWRVNSLEGFLAHHIARPSFADAVAAGEQGLVNTDDRCLVEFGFARGVAANGRSLSCADVSAAAEQRGEQRPVIGGQVDWSLVEDGRFAMPVLEGTAPALAATLTPEQWQRGLAHKHYVDGNLKGALEAWRAQPRPPSSPLELEIVAASLADAGEEESLALTAKIRPFHPAEAAGIEAWLRYRQGDFDATAAALEQSFEGHRTDPFPSHLVMQRAFTLAEDIAQRGPGLADRMFLALSRPFVLKALENHRLLSRLQIARKLGPTSRCLEAFAPLEPHPFWDGEMLAYRLACYEAQQHPLAPRAARDLADWRRSEPTAILGR